MSLIGAEDFFIPTQGYILCKILWSGRGWPLGKIFRDNIKRGKKKKENYIKN